MANELARWQFATASVYDFFFVPVTIGLAFLVAILELSGRRHRIVLARALLAGAPVMVLDEPTAHLAPGTASELMRDVFSAAGDHTVLLRTHRTGGLERVDRVVVLEQAGQR